MIHGGAVVQQWSIVVEHCEAVGEQWWSKGGAVVESWWSNGGAMVKQWWNGVEAMVQ